MQSKASSKPPSEVSEQKIQWHPGFTAAMKLELIRYADQLTFHEEYLLNAKPIQMDLLIIEKKEGLEIENVIARHFRRYNVFEYKSPEDEMNIDTFFKVNAYACLYKAAAQHVDQIRAEDILVTLVRAHKPVKLLEWLEESYSVNQEYSGIYYAEKAGFFSVQLIISEELPEGEAVWLQSLTDRLEKQQAEKVLAKLEETLYGEYERTLIEAILKVSMTANKELYKKVGEEERIMFDALREIMESDFQKAENRGEMKKARETTMKLAEMGLPIDKIASAVEVSAKQVEEWLAESLVTV